MFKIYFYIFAKIYYIVVFPKLVKTHAKWVRFAKILSADWTTMSRCLQGVDKAFPDRFRQFSSSSSTERF